MIVSDPAWRVEIDEAYIGGRRRAKNVPQNSAAAKDAATKEMFARKRGNAVRSPIGDKATVVSLVRRGKVRSMHLDRVTSET